MAGYSRQDTNNNIANGNVIDADDLDNEFNAIEDAFNASTGHNHDGSAGGGATINSLGPSSDFVVSATEIKAKTPSTLSVGTSGVPFLDGHFDGTLNTDILSVDETSTFTGAATFNGGITGNVTGDLTGDIKNADGTVVVDVGTDAVATVLTGNVTGNLTGDVLNSDATTVLDVGSDVVTAVFTGNVTGKADTADAWHTSRTVTFATGDVTGSFSINGSADVTDVDLSVASSLTTDLVGDVYASNGTSKILESGTDGTDAVLTGTVSSLSNHDTDNLSEGTTNVYYTDTRVDTHLNTGTATSNQLLSWTGTDYDWIDAGASANYYVDGASWDVQTGVLTLQVSGSTNVTVDLDGRYAEGTIPTNNNQLANGAGYATTSQVPSDNNQLQNGAGYVTSSQVGTIPTDNAQLANGAQYATTSQIPSVPTNNNQLSNGAGYATTSQIPTSNSQLQNGASYATTSQVPTNNSQLSNGAGYITSASPPSTAGAVGTYMLSRWVGAAVTFGSTKSGSLLRPAGGYGGTEQSSTNTPWNGDFYNSTAGNQSGSWRHMGHTSISSSSNAYRYGLYIRIS